MNRMSLLLAAAVIALASQTVSAQVVRCTVNGRTIYATSCPNGSEGISVNTSNSAIDSARRQKAEARRREAQARQQAAAVNAPAQPAASQTVAAAPAAALQAPKTAAPPPILMNLCTEGFCYDTQGRPYALHKDGSVTAPDGRTCSRAGAMVQC